MRAVKINLASRELHLAFTVEAMFQIQDKFGGSGELVEAIRDGGREGFHAACCAATILAEQGELARRSLGYDPGPMADAEAIAASMTPSDIPALKTAIPAALSLGYGRDVEAEDEIDLGLAELNAQKKPGDPRPLHPHGGGLRAVSEGHAAVRPRRGERPVGAVSARPRREAAGDGRMKPPRHGAGAGGIIPGFSRSTRPARPWRSSAPWTPRGR